MKKLTLILAAICAVSVFAQGKTDPLDSQLKQVYRNFYHELKQPPSRYYPRGQHLVQRDIYTVTLMRKLSDTSGVFHVVCRSTIQSNIPGGNDNSEYTRPDIIIINLQSIADMAKGDSIKLNKGQTLWGLGTVTIPAAFGNRRITLRQFSFRRKDALAYLAAKKNATQHETCPTCGQPMPKNY